MSWKELELGEVCEGFQNGIGKGKKYYGKGTKVANIGDLYKSPTFQPIKYSLLEVTKSEISKYKLEIGDILFVRSSLKREGVAYCSMYDSLEECLFSSFMIRIRTKAELVDSRFLAYQLRSEQLRERLVNASNTSTITNISQPKLKTVKVTVPPLSEQKRIATILDEADRLRQKDKQVIEKYNLLSQSVFLEMFGDPVTNPKGWGKVKIESLCSDIVDCVNKTASSVDYITDYKMIRTTNIRNFKVNLEKVRFVEEDVFTKWNRRLTPQRGDIVFTREAPMGEAGIIQSDDKVFLGQRTMLFRVDNLVSNNYYLLFQLMGNGVDMQIQRLSMGSTVKHLSVPACKKFKILLPPLALQNEFAERIVNIEQQKSQAEKSLAKSEALFQSLLQRAFKGEL